jgi:hypothetical protein
MAERRSRSRAAANRIPEGMDPAEYVALQLKSAKDQVEALERELAVAHIPVDERYVQGEYRKLPALSRVEVLNLKSPHRPEGDGEPEAEFLYPDHDLTHAARCTEHLTVFRQRSLAAAKQSAGEPYLWCAGCLEAARAYRDKQTEEALEPKPKTPRASRAKAAAAS